MSPTPTVEAELADQDQYEVRIYDAEWGRRLVAAIEIVSPSNKDRPDTREVFSAKLAALLQEGVCVSIVDPVSIRQASLYAELLALLGRTDPNLDAPARTELRGDLPAAADRVTHARGRRRSVRGGWR